MAPEASRRTLNTYVAVVACGRLPRATRPTIATALLATYHRGTPIAEYLSVERDEALPAAPAAAGAASRRHENKEVGTRPLTVDRSGRMHACRDTFMRRQMQWLSRN